MAGLGVTSRGSLGGELHSYANGMRKIKKKIARAIMPHHPRVEGDGQVGDEPAAGESPGGVLRGEP
jgi:hypothetical protein